MFTSKFQLKVLRRTPENMAILTELAEREPSKEYHLLVNKKKVALVTHRIWETCEYCNCPENEHGVIELS